MRVDLSSWSMRAKQSIALYLLRTLPVKQCSVFVCLFVFRCFYRKGSVIADMELTFNQEVGSSEVEALLSEVTKDGKLGDLGVSQVVTDGFIKGQLLFTLNIFQSQIRNGILTVVKFKSNVVLFNRNCLLKMFRRLLFVIIKSK